MCFIKKIKSDIFAFTLAEVLITLGIIGVVAAMTIPTLINNYRKTQYVTSLKKAYTEINQVLAKISTDSGCVNDLKCTGLFASGTTHKSLGDALIPYFNILKKCGIEADKGCWSESSNWNIDGSSNNKYNFDSYDKYKFVTADGMSVYIENLASGGGPAVNCGSDYSMSGKGNLTQTCGIVWIDVNGVKLPNNFGRDVFTFFITNGKGALLYPGGGSDDTSIGFWKNPWTGVTKCDASDKSGWPCTGRIMENGWQMDY